MGEATAAFAARAGADVVLVDIVAERAEAVAAIVAGHGRRGIRFRTMTALSRGETPRPENSIAERVLGLPPDIRVDKGIPFNRVPTGTR